ncbi:folate family ECF transporter S component [Apilactobacillus sp. TMW 2.2459]|uniref:folate family ECF transporter S component n=1 Tax=Apilactobacillus xinyiensis TaxID=2841032 RepID=UPI00200F2598|nr:folate family ECF transporter S component [Apilactobacillus xinyiensis]MCL0311705.1 folate family ECF transporter S component [Apilactobacillus xinyiensis]
MSIIFVNKFKVPKLQVRDVVYIGMLMALSFIISKFNINTQFISIRLAFIITVIIGYSYGPIWGASIAGISDILFTFINGQMYYPGFTVSAVLTGFLYGLFLYKNKEAKFSHIVVCQILIVIFVNTILNTLWLTLLYNIPWQTIITARIIKQLITTPIQIAIIFLILRSKNLKKLLFRI